MDRELLNHAGANNKMRAARKVLLRTDVFDVVKAAPLLPNAIRIVLLYPGKLFAQLAVIQEHAQPFVRVTLQKFVQNPVDLYIFLPHHNQVRFGEP